MIITSQTANDANQQQGGCNDCDGPDTPTRKSIYLERSKYCDKVYESAGEVVKWEKTYYGQTTLYKERKCMFLWTEENFRRYRNTELCIGTELLQSNEQIKENVSNYIKWGGELSTGLKNIFKAIKEVKTKMTDLVDAADKLAHAQNDPCNCTQMSILLGKPYEPCKNQNTKPAATPNPGQRPSECSDVEDNLNKLTCMPKALSCDINSIFKASSDIIGIQVFSNIGTLEPLQKTLSDRAKEFEKKIQETLKLRETDLKKQQDDLVKTVQDTTKAIGGLYNKRNDFEAALSTTKDLCCPNCNCGGCGDSCIQTKNICDARLKECEICICKICGSVQETFCGDGGDCGCGGSITNTAK